MSVGTCVQEPSSSVKGWVRGACLSSHYGEPETGESLGDASQPLIQSLIHELHVRVSPCLKTKVESNSERYPA